MSPMKTVGYVRVSTDKQADRGVSSPDGQLERAGPETGGAGGRSAKQASMQRLVVRVEVVPLWVGRLRCGVN
jgi:hypothetical protein